MQGSLRKSGDRALTKNYNVALYIADSGRYWAQFVREFPVSVNGMALGCGMGWPTAQVLFPYKALAKIALSGDKTAIRKALLVETDGIIAEYMTDQARRGAVQNRTPRGSSKPHGSGLSEVGRRG
jgi:hypothetical protein